MTTSTLPQRTKIIANKVPLALVDKTAKDMVLTFVTKVLDVNSGDIDPIVQTAIGDERRIVIQTAFIPDPDKTLRELYEFAKKATEYMAMLDEDIDFHIQETGAGSSGENLVCKRMVGGTFWPDRLRVQCALGDVTVKSNRPRRLTPAEKAAGFALFPQEAVSADEEPICGNVINILSSAHSECLSQAEIDGTAAILNK